MIFKKNKNFNIFFKCVRIRDILFWTFKTDYLVVFSIGKFAKAMNAGFTMVLLILVPTFLGMKLDKKFGTKFIFSLIFALLGSASAFYYVYRIGAQKDDKGN